MISTWFCDLLLKVSLRFPCSNCRPLEIFQQVSPWIRYKLNLSSLCDLRLRKAKPLSLPSPSAVFLWHTAYSARVSSFSQSKSTSQLACCQVSKPQGLRAGCWYLTQRWVIGIRCFEQWECFWMTLQLWVGWCLPRLRSRKTCYCLLGWLFLLWVTGLRIDNHLKALGAVETAALLALLISLLINRIHLTEN